jgi:hypothetical protein
MIAGPGHRLHHFMPSPKDRAGFCVIRSCFVVLSRALGSICNGHPASEVVKNQSVAVIKIPNLTVRQASNQVVGGSNPSGRTKVHFLNQ